MYPYWYLGELRIPSYTTAVVLGLIICNIIAFFIIRKQKLKYGKFIIAELMGGLFAFIGSKLLSSFQLIFSGQAARITFISLITPSFTYYGVLAGFLFGCWLGFKILKEDSKQYSSSLVFLVSVAHAFMKLACTLAGCCYGIPYEGPFSIILPAESEGPSGIPLFPSQPLEAIVSLVIATVLLILFLRKKKVSQTGLLLIMYGSSRFVLEFFRYHSGGSLFATAHIYSLICIAAGIAIMTYSHLKKKN